MDAKRIAPDRIYLQWPIDEIERGLILIYQSRNNNCNYVTTDVKKLGNYTGNQTAKQDLINMLRRLADTIEKEY